MTISSDFRLAVELFCVEAFLLLSQSDKQQEENDCKEVCLDVAHVGVRSLGQANLQF